MARVPQSRQTALPTTNVGAAPINPNLAFMGTGAEWENIAALAGVGKELAFEKLRKQRSAKDLTASAKQKTAMKEAENEYQQAIQNDGDTKNWDGYRQESLGKLNDKLGELEWGTVDKQSQGSDLTENWTAIFNQGAQFQEADQNIVDAIGVTEAAYIATPTPENKAAYEEALQARFSPEEIDIVVKETGRKGAIKQIQDRIVLDPEGIKADLEAELESRKGKDNKEDVLSNTDVNDLLKSANRELSQRSTRDQIALEESASQVEPTWLDKWAEGKLTEAEILAWDAGVTDPDVIRDMVDIKEEWIKKIGQKQGETEGYNNVVMDMNLNPDKWSATRLYANVPANLTREEANKLVGNLKDAKTGSNANSTALHTRYQAKVRSQFSQKLFGSIKKKKSKAIRDDISEKLTDYMIENRNASPDDWRKFYNETTQDRKESGSLLSNVFRTLLRAESLGLGLLTGDPFFTENLAGLKPKPGVNIPPPRPAPKTQEEYDELPSGTEYVDSNGAIRRKS